MDNGVSASSGLEASLLVADSRRARPGSVFVALPGHTVHGLDYARAAVERGAVCVLSDRAADVGAPLVVIPDLTQRLPALAASFYARPSLGMPTIGVTGTNGKTTTTYLIERILTEAGLRPGLIGTVEYRCGEHRWPAPNTTPDSVTLQGILAEMREAGGRSVVMEVSSHALDEHRVDETSFDVGVFTNLSRDHLDYHGSMEAYYQAKARLFRALLAASPKPARAVINVDDPYGARLASEVETAVWTVGLGTGDFSFAEPNLHPAGFEVDVHTPYGAHRIECDMPGRHNVYNAVQALAAALAIGVEPEPALRALRSTRGVPGRLEHFAGAGIHVYVDYAHSEDALANVLDSLRAFAAGRVITVFGCGGDRDRGKRPRMGLAAGARSDVVVLTSDNPRTEDPTAILAEVQPGIVESGLAALDGERGYVVEPDRRKAIAAAVSLARPGDVVLVAGKGHETYQIIGAERLPFDDREEVRAALQRREVAG